MESEGRMDRHKDSQRERLAQSLEPGPRIEPWENSDEDESLGGNGKPVYGNGSMRDLETIQERPMNAQPVEQPEEAELVGSYDLLESYSKEMVLSSFPVLDSDVFPPLRVKSHGGRHARGPKQFRQQTSQRVVRCSPPRVRKLGVSPYDIEWSKRMLERHFHVYFRSEREVCRVGRSSVERQRKGRKS